MENLKDKVAIVTGACGGIGKEIVKALINNGAKVLLTDINEEKLISLCGELGENADYYKADITNKNECLDIAKKCKDTFGKLNILINSAGVSLRKPLLEVNKEEFMKLYEINVYSNLAMTQACANMLEESKSGEIISLVSSSGMYPHEQQGAYCATKYAQRVLNEVLNVELFNKDIRIHNLYPSAVDTPMVRNARPDLKGDVYCKAEELAEIMIFILTHRNNSVIDNLIVRRFTKRPDEI